MEFVSERVRSAIKRYFTNMKLNIPIKAIMHAKIPRSSFPVWIINAVETKAPALEIRKFNMKNIVPATLSNGFARMPINVPLGVFSAKK